MNFASDNRSGACPEVVEAVAAEAARSGGGYGADDTTRAMAAAFDELFERPVTVFPVSTGTAANSLALACVCPPWGAVICHDEAHVYVDESGGPEFFGHGLRLATVGGAEGRIDPAEVAALFAAGEDHGVHSTALSALSVTQATEAGTVYPTDAIGELCELAHAHGLVVHLDGARFANAAAATGASPAELTWGAGVDVAVWGATKNGAMAAEAVVFFDDELAATFERRMKRGGQLGSKLRFTSAQILALLTDDVWLRNARHANDAAAGMARRLVSAGHRLAFPVEANMVYLEVDTVDVDAWRSAGADFYLEHKEGRDAVRLVTSWATTTADIDALCAIAAARS